jgi:hypothetical protein
MPSIFHSTTTQYVAMVLGVLLAHTVMQHYYNLRCRGNLLKVLLYNEAPVCRYIKFGITSIEDAAYAVVGLLFPALLAPFTALLAQNYGQPRRHQE